MVTKLSRMDRRAVARKVIGRSADNSRDRSDLAGDQARGLQLSNPKRDIKTVLDRIQQVVAENQLQLQFGVVLHELRNRRSQPQRTEGHRCVDPEQPARRGLSLADGLV